MPLYGLGSVTAQTIDADLLGQALAKCRKKRVKRIGMF